jgi:histidinol phosphatase-like enzyme
LNETPFLIDMPRSILIGDSPSDLQAGRAAGVGRLVYVGGRDAAVPRAAVVVGSVLDVLDVVPPLRLAPVLSS